MPQRGRLESRFCLGELVIVRYSTYPYWPATIARTHHSGLEHRHVAARPTRSGTMITSYWCKFCNEDTGGWVRHDRMVAFHPRLLRHIRLPPDDSLFQDQHAALEVALTLHHALPNALRLRAPTATRLLPKDFSPRTDAEPDDPSMLVSEPDEDDASSTSSSSSSSSHSPSASASSPSLLASPRSANPPSPDRRPSPPPRRRRTVSHLPSSPSQSRTTTRTPSSAPSAAAPPPPLPLDRPVSPAPTPTPSRTPTPTPTSTVTPLPPLPPEDAHSPPSAVQSPRSPSASPNSTPNSSPTPTPTPDPTPGPVSGSGPAPSPATPPAPAPSTPPTPAAAPAPAPGAPPSPAAAPALAPSTPPTPAAAPAPAPAPGTPPAPASDTPPAPASGTPPAPASATLPAPAPALEPAPAPAPATTVPPDPTPDPVPTPAPDAPLASTPEPSPSAPSPKPKPISPQRATPPSKTPVTPMPSPLVLAPRMASPLFEQHLPSSPRARPRSESPASPSKKRPRPMPTTPPELNNGTTITKQPNPVSATFEIPVPPEHLPVPSLAQVDLLATPTTPEHFGTLLSALRQSFAHFHDSAQQAELHRRRLLQNLQSLQIEFQESCKLLIEQEQNALQFEQAVLNSLQELRRAQPLLEGLKHEQAGVVISTIQAQCGPASAVASMCAQLHGEWMSFVRAQLDMPPLPAETRGARKQT